MNKKLLLLIICTFAFISVGCSQGVKPPKEKIYFHKVETETKDGNRITFMYDYIADLSVNEDDLKLVIGFSITDNLLEMAYNTTTQEFRSNGQKLLNEISDKVESYILEKYPKTHFKTIGFQIISYND